MIDPEYRNQGLGLFLLKRLTEIAKEEDANLERVLCEVVTDGENAALHAAHLTLLTIDLRDASPTPLDELAHYYVLRRGG